MEHFIPLLVCEGVFFYSLSNSNDKLSKKDIETLQSLKGMLLSQFDEAYDSKQGLKKHATTLLKQVDLFILTKKEFIERKFISFDDKSNEHAKAFVVANKKDFPKSNMMIRLSGAKKETIDLESI